MSDLKASMYIAGSGMRAQSERLKVIAENIANAESTGTTPGAAPYQRKTIHFKNVLDKEIGANVVKVDKIGVDNSEFIKEYKPGHPAADEQGYILRSNVNTMIEAADMREAERTYEANLSVIETTKGMITRTLDLLR